jgi:2-hydroxychromene-2-carboxylate isomerase
MNQPEIEFFFDIGSPYSYLAATQIDGLGERSGARIRWRPFLLGGVFKATKNIAPATVQAKANWMLEDLALWATLYDAPFKFNSKFPLNTITTMRVITGAAETTIPALTLALFDAMWADDLDVSSPDVIRQVAESIELDGDSLLEAAAAQETKDLLRATTDEAVSRGAFGAPTFFVGERMFWGNDRLPIIEAVLA